MQWCGLLFDEHVNEETVGKEGLISPDKSRIDVIVIPVDEASVLAQEAVNLL